MNDKPTNGVPKRVRAGNLDALKRKLWRALLTSETLLDNDDPATRLRAVHALSQTAATYRAVYTDSDLERRISILEQGRKGKIRDD